MSKDKYLQKTYKITGMDCPACSKLIEMDLEDIGVTAVCNYQKQTLSVEYDPAKISEDKIKKIVNASKYSLS